MFTHTCSSDAPFTVKRTPSTSACDHSKPPPHTPLSEPPAIHKLPTCEHSRGREGLGPRVRRFFYICCLYVSCVNTRAEKKKRIEDFDANQSVLMRSHHSIACRITPSCKISRSHSGKTSAARPQKKDVTGFVSVGMKCHILTVQYENKSSAASACCDLSILNLLLSVLGSKRRYDTLCARLSAPPFP